MNMNILCSCDNNYAPYCGIMLTSLFINNKDSKIIVYVLVNGVNEQNRHKFQILAGDYGQTIHFIEVSDEFAEGFPLWENDHVSVVAYYRLFAANLLPEHIDKILYLDCDIIIKGTVRNLYETDIDSYSAGVVIDNVYDKRERNDDLAIRDNNIYFNSGAMLINLQYWREHNLQYGFLDFIGKHRNHLHTHDQDVLNGVLQGTVKYLSVQNNFQTSFMFKSLFHKYPEDLQKEISESSQDNIVILHYCTAVKPWNCWYSVAYPYGSIWEKYKKTSLWSDIKLNNSQKEQLTCWILKMMCKLHLKKIEL